ncbi:putative DNA-binding domain-containing protein [Luteimonas sp. SX5]|uniref:DNA-binding domain-containing protein n=1 Tax=Luteimonas galliterrae TaxID=2940486 RepID=A0ABT0ME94_9GAMM|nr:putative DNA-binding domain-containing protein [Luteimonas galliterrae]MCL1633186.1 putative DNA-binding domain-containing protein [Luteimonas galliterrae]
MAEASATLRQQQFALARHVRDPQANPPPPDIEDRRLAIYRDLLYNNIESLLSGNFPVIRKTLADAEWHALVRAFLIGHRCRTPLFTEIGREFIRFLETRQQAEAGDPPWLAELAHYEWVELALQISDEPLPPHDPQGDPMQGLPQVSPFAWALAYRWPVQRIGPAYRPSQAPGAPTLLLVRRDGHGDVRFAEISPLVYRLLELLGDSESRTGRQVLTQLAVEAAAADVEAFEREGASMLRHLREEGTLLGTQPG